MSTDASIVEAEGISEGESKATAVSYDEKNLKTLKNAAHIRQNPGVYVGTRSPPGYITSFTRLFSTL
jgi:hypothetical protein